MARNTTKAGGGINSRVVREVGNRFGNRASVVNPRAVSQIGAQLSNHVTESGGKVGRAAETFYTGRKPAGLPGGVPLGNEVAKNIGGGGPGTGRKLYGQSGSNQTYGQPATGLPRIANTKNQWPDTNTKPR
jgi:hypothetical protein